MRLGSLPGHPRRRGLGDDRGAGRPLPAGPVLAALGAPRSGDVADRRGRGVLGAAWAAALAPAGRRPGGGVGTERRADRRPGHLDLHRRRRRPRAALHARGHRLRARGRRRRRARDRLRRGLVDAPRRPAVVGPVPARRAVPRPPGLRRVRVASTPPGFAAIYVAAPGPRQLRPAAPAGDEVVRRGGGVARADRAVRDARAAAHPEPDHTGGDRDRRRRQPPADLRRPADHGVGQLGRPADAVARDRVRLVGRASRGGADRARHDPAGREGAPTPNGSSTSCS